MITDNYFFKADLNKINQLEKATNKIKAEQKLDNNYDNLSLSSNEFNSLEQNIPNPCNYETVIKFHINDNARQASILIYGTSGKKKKNINIVERGHSSITLNAGELTPGIYVYALVVDKQIVETKNMVITK